MSRVGTRGLDQLGVKAPGEVRLGYARALVNSNGVKRGTKFKVPNPEGQAVIDEFRARHGITCERKTDKQKQLAHAVSVSKNRRKSAPVPTLPPMPRIVAEGSDG